MRAVMMMTIMKREPGYADYYRPFSKVATTIDVICHIEINGALRHLKWAWRASERWRHRSDLTTISMYRCSLTASSEVQRASASYLDPTLICARTTLQYSGEPCEASPTCNIITPHYFWWIKKMIPINNQYHKSTRNDDRQIVHPDSPFEHISSISLD